MNEWRCSIVRRWDSIRPAPLLPTIDKTTPFHRPHRLPIVAYCSRPVPFHCFLQRGTATPFATKQGGRAESMYLCFFYIHCF